ncbi:MAG: ring-opening amidohydrolase [Leptolyngbyaceae cyanobacterium bins.302]|nr:ring-opening amidohydrolase [Leptolyngbyaceae cyanobacterium bins.302]
MKVDVFKIAQNSPADLSGLEALIQAKKLDPTAIVAIMGKTEGNGCVNDFTRGYAVQTLKHFLGQHLGSQAEQIVYVMSGGTEGVLSPHLTVFTRQTQDLVGEPHWGLVLGTSQTRDFAPEEIGTLAMVQVVAASVKAAIAEAGIAPADVHFVQIKCPLIHTSRTQAHDLQSLKTQDGYKSMAYSRGASALGIALALGELSPDQITDADICANYGLYSAVASTSAGVELQNCEILVLGNAPTSYSSYVIGHSVMQHALDTAAIHQAIASTGRSPDQTVSNQTVPNQIVNVFAKAEADPSGQILGQRHTMLDDSDISHTRMARAVVGAVIAAAVQDPMIYVSGGAEHQGPAGGGPIAVIAQAD